jgi:hypothetical protein
MARTHIDPRREANLYMGVFLMIVALVIALFIYSVVR